LFASAGPWAPSPSCGKPSGSTLCSYFRMVSVSFSKNLHTSRLKCPLAALPVRALRKRDDSLVRNGGLEKDLHHSRVECPFAIQLIRKRSFCSRVVKAKVVLHRKIQGCGHTPDPKWSFRSRVAKALIVFNGKSAYFCSILGPRDAQSMHIYG